MKNKQIRETIILSSEATLLLKQAISKYNLSARTYFRMIKVAQTIADLDNSDRIEYPHIAESLQFRVRTGDE